MSEIGLAEIFGMGEAIGIIGTLFVILYFSRKQTQSLSVDIETKVLNDLAERMHALHQIVIDPTEKCDKQSYCKFTRSCACL